MQNLSECTAKLLAQFYNRHLTNKTFHFEAQKMEKPQESFAAWEVNKVDGPNNRD